MYPVTSASIRDSENKYSVADILSSMSNGQPPQNTVSYSPKYSFGGSITPTTANLTPTTLTNIEQTFIQLQNVPENAERQYQTGFVPPSISTSRDSSSTSSSDQEWDTSQPVKKLKTNSRTAVLTEADIYTPGYLSTSRKPPQRRKDISSGNPEEAHRRLVRRERNKVAAAKCRQRRVDHTNVLVAETDKLDGERNELENEIQSLQQQKEHLEFLLQAHQPLCKLHHHGTQQQHIDVKVKVEPVEGMGSPYTTMEEALLDENRESYRFYYNKQPRPTTLSIPLKPPTTQLGIPINTPSSGIFTFGLDSIVDGHTGLTPLTGIPSSGSGHCDVKDLSSPTLMNL